MEDPDAEEVKEFVEGQVALTDSVLARCEEREKLRGQITALFDHPRYDTPYKRGGKYFYYHNTGLQAQSVLYVQVVFVAFRWLPNPIQIESRLWFQWFSPFYIYCCGRESIGKTRITKVHHSYL